MTNICHANEHAGSSSSVVTRTINEGEWIAKNVHSKEGKALFAKMTNAHGAERAEVLRSEAAKEGIQPCPYADEIASRAKTAPTP